MGRLPSRFPDRALKKPDCGAGLFEQPQTVLEKRNSGTEEVGKSVGVERLAGQRVEACEVELRKTEPASASASSAAEHTGCDRRELKSSALLLRVLRVAQSTEQVDAQY